MKCIVLGAGVVGVTTAHWLARDGHEVVVIDRAAAPASEASDANAGLLTPGHALAWAKPAMRPRILKALVGLEANLEARPQLSLAWWLWGLRFLLDCTDAKFRAFTTDKYRLCRYSLDVMQALRAELSLDYAQRTGGTLYLFRRQELLDQHVRSMEVLARLGQTFEVVDRDRCVDLEPALAPARDQLAGAVYAASDESGDCGLFTRLLAEDCRGRGVTFLDDANIVGLEADGERISAVVTERGRHTGDIFIVALGAWSPLVLRTVGVRIPVQPVKGYSLTAPISNPDRAPAMGGLDEEAYLAYCRMGDRLRVAGSISYVGYDLGAPRHQESRVKRAAINLFPDACDYDRAEFRACLRPQTPEGTPLLGPGPRFKNLHCNTGHGSMGWSMACGSSKIVADLIAGRQPEIAMSGLRWR